MSKSGNEGIKCDAVFEGYTGRLAWTVSHPRHKKPLTVLAPKEEAALVAAAEYWGERWQSYSFYPYCEIFRTSVTKEKK